MKNQVILWWTVSSLGCRKNIWLLPERPGGMDQRSKHPKPDVPGPNVQPSTAQLASLPALHKTEILTGGPKKRDHPSTTYHFWKKCKKMTITKVFSPSLAGRYSLVLFTPLQPLPPFFDAQSAIMRTPQIPSKPMISTAGRFTSFMRNSSRITWRRESERQLSCSRSCWKCFFLRKRRGTGSVVFFNFRYVYFQVVFAGAFDSLKKMKKKWYERLIFSVEGLEIEWEDEKGELYPVESANKATLHSLQTKIMGCL